MAYDVSKLVTLGQLKSLALKVKSEDAAIVGSSSDAASAITVYGARKLASSILGESSDASSAATVYGARALADSKVASISAGNNGIAISTSSPASATAPAISLQLSAKTGNQLTIETGSGEEGLYFSTPAAVTYSIVKDATATSGYAATYHLTADGVNTGTAIDIPKDFLVKSASVETVTVADQPYTGAQVGDKYIDFVINAKDASATDEHLYLPVNDLVDVYTAGNGINVSNSNVISAVVNSSNANGLSVGANGLAMATVVASTSGTGGSNGAMTAAQAEKLAGVTAGATKVEASTTNGNIKIDNVETVVYDLSADVATDAEVAEMVAEVWPST